MAQCNRQKEGRPRPRGTSDDDPAPGAALAAAGKAKDRRDVLMAMSPAVPDRNAGIRRFAIEAGWNLMPISRIVGGFGALNGWRGDGALVTLRQDEAVLSFVKGLRRRGIPVVDLTCERPDIRVPRVNLDNRAVGRLAAGHFAERNFRHAAWFSTYWMNVHAERFAGFAKAWNDRSPGNREPVARWVLCEDVPAARRNDSRAVAKWFAGLLSSVPKPLALLCHCGEDAARVLSECRALGIAVPEEIAILSAGDYYQICEMQSVPISSFEINGERHGYEAAELLRRLMDGEAPPRGPVLVPPGPLRVRASTDWTAAADPLVARALALVSENLSRPWGVAQLCRELGVSPLRLERHFDAELGRPPGEEILRQRLARARALLLETTLTVEQIAARCGFCHAAYLSNLFRRETGLSPRAFAKRVRTGSAMPVP